MKFRLTRGPILIGAGLVLLVGVVLVAWKLALPPRTPKLEVDGGVILVFEIASPKSPRPGQETKVDAAALAEQLKTRIDPDDVHHITVRPAGATRIEFLLPACGGHHPERAPPAKTFFQDFLRK